MPRKPKPQDPATPTTPNATPEPTTTPGPNGTPEPPTTSGPDRRQGLAGVILADLGELEPFADEPPTRGGLQRLLLATLALVLVATLATGALIAMGKLQLTAAASPSTSAPTVQPTTEPSAEASAAPSESTAPAESPAPSESAAPIESAPPTESAAPAGSPTAAPAATPFYYTVQAGETLTILSLRFGVTVDALVKANNIADRNLIITGHRLLIPVP
jgi:LysM repeat protein